MSLTLQVPYPEGEGPLPQIGHGCGVRGTCVYIVELDSDSWAKG